MSRQEGFISSSYLLWMVRIKPKELSMLARHSTEQQPQP